MEPEPDTFDVLPLLIADVYEAAGAMRRRGDQTASAAGLTQARWQVLSVLSDGDRTVPRVARRLGVSRQAVQRIVDELRDEGLVGLKTNPDHERSPLLHLTEQGSHALGLITAEARRWNEQVSVGIALGDLAVARGVLRALITAAA
jgi:DNA-binding MarR family transcriptional regulator